MNISPRLVALWRRHYEHLLIIVQYTSCVAAFLLQATTISTIDGIQYQPISNQNPWTCSSLVDWQTISALCCTDCQTLADVSARHSTRILNLGLDGVEHFLVRNLQQVQCVCHSSLIRRIKKVYINMSINIGYYLSYTTQFYQKIVPT